MTVMQVSGEFGSAVAFDGGSLVGVFRVTVSIVVNSLGFRLCSTSHTFQFSTYITRWLFFSIPL